MRLISSKQNAAKHKSYDLCCYCLLKGYERSEVEQTGYAKHRLSKFKGIKKENFLLHLKECKFRYNTKTIQENLYQKLLKLIRSLTGSKTKSQLKIRLSLIEPI